MEEKEAREREVPSITEEQMELTRRTLLATPRGPLLPVGTVTACPVCGGDMVTTNNLRRAIPTPSGLIILAGLPGAPCVRCRSVAYDAAAAATILENSGSEIT